MSKNHMAEEESAGQQQREECPPPRDGRAKGSYRPRARGEPAERGEEKKGVKCLTELLT